MVCLFTAVGDSKAEIRNKVWDYLMDNRLGSFPYPPHRRISNFKVCVSDLTLEPVLEPGTRLLVVLLTRASFYVVIFILLCMFCLLVVLVTLSVPVQVIDWKVSSPK